MLDPIPERPHLGLVRDGWQVGTRWNVQRFITTKREEYAHEREVRAALWLLHTGDGVNRHIDINNRVHRRPVYAAPSAMPFGIKRPIDLHTVIIEVVLNPSAEDQLSTAVKSPISETLGRDLSVRASSLTTYSRWLPTADELRRFGVDRRPRSAPQELDPPPVPERPAT